MEEAKVFRETGRDGR